MRKVLGFLWCFIPAIGFTQLGMKKTELSSDYFLADVNPNGAEMFAVKYKSACIAYNKKTKEFLLYGDANGTDIIFLEKIPKVSLRFYPEKFVACEYKDGKVHLSSQMPGRATVVTGLFDWREEHLIWEKEITFDLSELQVKRADDLVKAGKIAEALSTYDSVQYSEHYFDARTVGIQLLLASVPVLDECTGKRKFKDAIDLTDRILGFKGLKWFHDLKTEAELKTSIGKGIQGLSYSGLQQYLETYTRSLVEAKMYDICIEKVNLYWKYFTNSAELLLNIADAYYGKKDKIKASEFYVKYVNQAKLLKKEKEIPYYVDQRIIK